MRVLCRLSFAIALAAGVVVLGVGSGSAAPTCTITWDGGAGPASWHTGTNWNTNVVPGPADHVCIDAASTVTYSTGTTSVLSVQVAGKLTISGGTLNLTDTGNDSNVATLAQSNGTLGGAATLNVTGTFAWSGGTMSDAGTTVIAAAATVNQTGFVTSALGRTIDNLGTYDLQGNFNLNNSGTSTFHNEPSGKLKKSAGTLEGSVFSAFDNDGSAQSTSGTLSFRGGSGTGTDTGSFGAAAATGTVNFAFGTHTLADASFVGGVTLSGGTVTIPDGAAVTAAGSNTINGGTLAGLGTFTVVSGSLTWSAGTMSDAGTTAVAAGATVNQTGFVTAALGRTIDNLGTYDLQGNFNLNNSGSSTFHNEATGTLKKSAGTLEGSVFSAFDNDGSAQSTSGTLSFRGGSGTGTDTGSFGSAAPTGTVNFVFGTHALAGATLLGGVTLSGGTLTVPDGAVATAAGANTITGGTLGGLGTFTVASGTLTWSGGTMSDQGKTVVEAGATLNQDAFTTLANGRTLDNAGTYDLKADRNVNASGAPTPVLHNSGTFKKSAGAGEGSIFAAFDNDGSAQANSGTLSFRAGSGSGTDTGSFGSAAPTGTVNFAFGTHTLADARFLGGVTLSSGTLTIPTGATVTAAGPNTISSGTLGGLGTLKVASGTLTWAGGTMTDAGTTVIAAGAALNQTAFATASNGRTLDNLGTYDVQGNFSLNSSGATSTFHNEATGTFKKSAGTGDSSIFPSLDNAGTVSSTAGKLSLRSSVAGAQGGTFTGASDAAHPVFAAGTFTLGPSATLTGTVEIGGATVGVPAAQTLTIGERLLLTAGALTGPGELDVPGTLVWKGGSQNGPATTKIAAGGELDVDASCSVFLRDGRALENDGTITVLHHSSLGSSGTPKPTIVNAGTINLDDTTGGCSGTSGITGVQLQNQAGATLVKAGSTAPATAVSRIDELVNDGVVQVNAGTLDLTGQPSADQTGSFGSTGPSSTLGFADGWFRLGAGASVFGQTAIDGALVQIEDGATLTVAASDKLTMSSGKLGGAGTLNVLGQLVWSGGYQVDSGTTAIAGGGTATINGSVVGLDRGRAFVNHGSVAWTAGDMYVSDGSSVINAGSITMSGDSNFGGGITFGWNYGSLFHNAGLLKKMGTGTAILEIPIDNDGTFEVSAGKLDVAGQLLNYAAPSNSLTAGAYVVHDGGTLELSPFQTAGKSTPVALNAATIVLDGPTSKVVYPDRSDPTGTARLDALGPLAANAAAGELTLENGRTLTTLSPLRNAGIATVSGASTLTTTGAYTQTGGITDLAGPSARLTATGAKAQVNGGRFGGSGSVGPELSAAGGTIEPGLGAAGILQADKYTAGAGSTLRMQIGDDTPGVAFDQLAVSGAAALGGTLAIETSPGFHPVAGDMFAIMTFASRTGTFSSVSGLDLGGGLVYEVVYGATDVTLHVTTAPAAPVAPSEPTRPPATAPATETRTVYDDGALSVLRGGWVHRTAAGFFDSTYTVAARRGAALARAGVVGRRLALFASACRRCGTIDVSWNGKLLRRIDLHRAGAAKTRLYTLARFAGVRTGTLTLRIVSRARPVLIDALVVDRR